MNVIVKEHVKNCGILPAVGQLWRHENSDEIWMRIEDTHNIMGEPIPSCKNDFFSVNLGTGKIHHTSKTENDIEILIPVSDLVCKVVN